MDKQDELLLTDEERDTIFDEVHVLPYKSVLDAYLSAQLVKVKQHEQKGLEEHEIKHIEIALKDHYKDEWCSVCDNIARKLGFSPME